MDERMYEEKLEERRRKREKKRKERRIKAILKINAGLIGIIFVLIVVKWASGRGDVTVEKAGGEGKRGDVMPIVMDAKAPDSRIEKETLKEKNGENF